MAETPVRRGPGRPRKVVADVPKSMAEPEMAQPEVESAPVPTPKSDADDMIGTPTAEGVEHISLPDGREYRCENGKIIERVR